MCGFNKSECSNRVYYFTLTNKAAILSSQYITNNLSVHFSVMQPLIHSFNSDLSDCLHLARDIWNTCQSYVPEFHVCLHCSTVTKGSMVENMLCRENRYVRSIEIWRHRLPGDATKVPLLQMSATAESLTTLDVPRDPN
jgi:hypothetical protein